MKRHNKRKNGKFTKATKLDKFNAYLNKIDPDDGMGLIMIVLSFAVVVAGIIEISRIF